jgi:RNA polymerase sigma-70 factor (ECF subfamily)
VKAADPHSSDEAQLVAQLQRDDTRRTAFATLVQRYGERLYWHIRKMVLVHADADDALQNTFVKVWENAAKFRGDAQLFTWLFRIATNEAITLLNQRKRLKPLPAGEAMQRIDNLRATDAHFSATDVQAKLQAAILTLPPKQRMVFNLRYFDEMPYEQMSQALGTSVGALKASYHHAAQKVEKLM